MMSPEDLRFPVTSAAIVSDQNPRLIIPVTKDIIVEQPEEPGTAKDIAIRWSGGMTPVTVGRYIKRLQSPETLVKESVFRRGRKHTYWTRLLTSGDVEEVKRLMFVDAATPSCRSSAVKNFAKQHGIEVYPNAPRPTKAERKQRREERRRQGVRH